MALAKYEFLNELHLRGRVVLDEKIELAALKGILTPESESKIPELVKKADEDIRKWSDEQGMAGMKRTGELGRVWLLFLAREFKDPQRIMKAAGTSMMRLLNHPNLVGLVDIVKEERVERGFEYMVWEYCSRGTLSRYLTTIQRKDGFPAHGPESLCWHVLEGISAALCWLHNGIKMTFPYDTHMQHDEDWHTILVGDVHPSNIFFCNPKPGETRGLVKLGCFTSSRVCPNPGPREGPPEFHHGRSAYWPLEIVEGREMWSPSAEIWSLGAVIWMIMTGDPPRLQEVGRGTATVLDYDCNVMTLLGYSKTIRDVLWTILSASPKARATSLELLHKVVRKKAVLDEGRQAAKEDQKLRRASKQGGMPKIFGNIDILLGPSEKIDDDSSDGPRNTASAKDPTLSYPARARTDHHRTFINTGTDLTPARPPIMTAGPQSKGKNPDLIGADPILRPIHHERIQYRSSPMPKRESVGFLVHGLVQGVNFGKFTQRRAKSHGLVGWVTNTSDRKVEGEVQGDASTIRILLHDIHTGGGSLSAKVDKSEEREIDVMGGESTFKVRR